MLVNISFDDEEDLEYVDIINMPDEIERDLDEVVNEFLRWLFDKTNDHKYWVIEDGQKSFCSYSTGAFVDWLNQYITKKEKTAIVAVSSRQIDDTHPIIYF